MPKKYEIQESAPTPEAGTVVCSAAGQQVADRVPGNAPYCSLMCLHHLRLYKISMSGQYIDLTSIIYTIYLSIRVYVDLHSACRNVVVLMIGLQAAAIADA